MVNRSRIKGTAWESEIVRTLIAAGRPYVERRALQGGLDRGDIAGIPLVAIQAKNAKTILLGPWLNEAHEQAVNDKADFGVVWMKRRGHTSAGNGFVVMDGFTFMSLLHLAGY